MKNSSSALRLSILCALLLLMHLFCNKSDDDKKLPAPVITAIEPVEGFRGDAITITGTNLQNATRVTFDGNASQIVQNSATEILTVVPPLADVGENAVVVTTAGGNSNEMNIEVFGTPEHVDELPPTLTKTIPEVNYTGYPVLIYGDNLSGTVKVSFNDKPAIIFTNNKKVITTNVPADIPAGNATIKVITTKGTATINFQVQGAPAGGPADLNFSIVDIPPPGYVPTISNNWTCGLFSAQADTFVELNSDPEFDETYLISGRFEFDFASNYNNLNYVEFTNRETGETFAGQFSSPSSNPCVLKMVLVSSKTGTLSECTFNRRNDDPDLVCDE